jgi:2',3'-cyclic-nucleotide 2'-phosphodiesterase/3'-nucleotidase
VNQAQTDYVRDYVRANLPQYAKLPVLSMTAPFKSGFAGVTTTPTWRRAAWR